MPHHYTATVNWERGNASFSDNRYSRVHRWTFDGGVEVPASASPQVVPVPLSEPAAVDPEEAFVATVSSCHMLWFLSLAAKAGYVVDTYEDEAEGLMERRADHRLAITRVTLRPRIVYAGTPPTPEQSDALHEAAHDACFIANSIRSEVVIEPREA
ncbi:MAG: OsmC family protein [Bacteroidota bacterium]